MHCFAWTPIKEATQADWDAFYKASDMMPKQMKMVKHVWYGKLLRPLSQFGTSDVEARKKAMAGESASGPLTFTRREYGMCIAFESAGDHAATLKKYVAEPYHKTWSAAYEKVRVPGTTTYDIVGQ